MPNTTYRSNGAHASLGNANVGGMLLGGGNAKTFATNLVSETDSYATYLNAASLLTK